jgi:hypothetical protein
VLPSAAPAPAGAAFVPELELDLESEWSTDSAGAGLPVMEAPVMDQPRAVGSRIDSPGTVESLAAADDRARIRQKSSDEREDVSV